ncbi:MAG TPA: hydrolase [Gemmataceae bacterium]|nr:hydrolase [Gemmataceae bacterium]
MPTPPRMSPADTALLVIDVQEKLLPKIAGVDRLVHNLSFLLEAARVVGIPVLATEQYPKGLGGTLPSLMPVLPQRWEKTDFSCCAVPELLTALGRDARIKVLLAGIETHVCVLQTALDLLARDFHVFLAVDTLGSRYSVDHETAIRRLEREGAILTTCETAVFEWLGGSRAAHFKEISQLVQRRMKALESI